MADTETTPTAGGYDPRSATVTEAIAYVMAHVSAVPKGGKNREQGYAFRRVEDIVGSLQGLMAEAGLSMTPRVTQRIVNDTDHATANGKTIRWVDLEVTWTLTTASGSAIEVVTWGEARDSSDKATNKAMTAAHKYALLLAFHVPTEDIADDADRDSPSSQRRAPGRPPRALLVQLRSEVMLAVKGLPVGGEERTTELRRLWEQARLGNALDEPVPLPTGWAPPGPERMVPLRELINGAIGAERDPDGPPIGQDPADPQVDETPLPIGDQAPSDPAAAAAGSGKFTRGPAPGWDPWAGTPADSSTTTKQEDTTP